MTFRSQGRTKKKKKAFITREAIVNGLSPSIISIIHLQSPVEMQRPWLPSDTDKREPHPQNDEPGKNVVQTHRKGQKQLTISLPW